MGSRSRRAHVEDIHEVARVMPHVSVEGSADSPVYQVGGKSFIFFRGPRPDAFDPETGERYQDVIVFWVADEGEKQALVEDGSTPYFTTPHFDGHRSVLLRASRIGELTRNEVAELVQDAWLARASARRGRDWLAALDRSDPRFIAPRRWPVEVPVFDALIASPASPTVTGSTGIAVLEPAPRAA